MVAVYAGAVGLLCTGFQGVHVVVAALNWLQGALGGIFTVTSIQFDMYDAAAAQCCSASLCTSVEQRAMWGKGRFQHVSSSAAAGPIRAFLLPALQCSAHRFSIISASLYRTLLPCTAPAGHLECAPSPDESAAAAAGGHGLIPLPAAALSAAAQPAAARSTGTSQRGRAAPASASSTGSRASSST
jgi:hypothetical protein